MTERDEKLTEEPDANSGGLSLEELSSSFGRLLGRIGQRRDTPVDGGLGDGGLGDGGLDDGGLGEGGPGNAATESTRQVELDSDGPTNTMAAPSVGRSSAGRSSAGSATMGKATPRMVVEGILFVGHPENAALTAQSIAGLMRGVTAEEVVCIIDDINRQYEHEGRPYRIVSNSGGHRMQLTNEFLAVRNKFYGKVRQAKLSQSAIDVLSVVAYRQPVTRPTIDELRNQSSGPVLNQLVRRQLIRVDRQPSDETGRKTVIHYRTTDRFLQLLGIDDVTDLPRSQEMELDAFAPASSVNLGPDTADSGP